MNIRAKLSTTHTVGFLLTPAFSMIAFTAALEVLRLTNHVLGMKAYTWRLYSPDGQAIQASNGLAIAVDGNYGDAGPMSLTIVCSGIDVQKYDHGPLIARLRKLAFHGVSIGALCTGPYILARAGLLNGHRCAIHWENFDSFREQFPDIDATQELYEIDRNRFTCAGGTAAIDMMLALVAAEKGSELAGLVSDQLIHHRMRASNERQRMELRARFGISHPKLLAVVDEMGRRLEEPVSCTQLARIVRLTPRQLERLFQRYLSTSPARYYQQMRLNRARQLLRQTSMPVLSVGLACGFVSASHFSKCYTEHFGRTPTEERKGVSVSRKNVTLMRASCREISTSSS
ncbi:AraC family transcriptional regulator [Labrys sp. WJW]|uniref:GlxA family transcriptional regulator n=1 Tax=Labrys sp. WJW TaxID=1737983 RepID=UPI000836FB7D|nr:GlxA family transcriptional regulator [Labrys sp. WJW]OCC05480.1 AraC family transcriptional regulator [Labrys sp. WJW]